MPRTRLFLAIALAWSLFSTAFPQANAKEVERQSLYDWFDSLGFTALRDGQFVEVKYGFYLGPTRNSEVSEFGFLEPNLDDGFRMFSLGLEHKEKRQFLKWSNGFAEVEQVDLRPWFERQRSAWMQTSLERSAYRFADRRPNKRR